MLNGNSNRCYHWDELNSIEEIFFARGFSKLLTIDCMWSSRAVCGWSWYLCIGRAFYALFIYLSHLICNIHKCRWKGKIPIKHNETNDESKPRTPLCTTLSKYHTECDNCFNHLFYQTNSGSWIVRTSRIFIPSLFSWSAKKTDGFLCVCACIKSFFFLSIVQIEFSVIFLKLIGIVLSIAKIRSMLDSCIFCIVQ